MLVPFVQNMMRTGCHYLFYLSSCHVSESASYFEIQLSNGVFSVYYEFINIAFGGFFPMSS